MSTKETIYAGYGKVIEKEIISLIRKGKGQLKRSAQETIEFGKTLIELKKLIGDNTFFNKTMQKEFGLIPRMAYRFMQVAERFGDRDDTHFAFGATVLYLLAQPSTNELVVEKAIEKAKTGEKITVEDVNNWRKEDKEKQEEEFLKMLSQFGPKIEKKEEEEEEEENKAKRDVDLSSPEAIKASLSLIKSYFESLNETLKNLEEDTIGELKDDFIENLDEFQSRIDEIRGIILEPETVSTDVEASAELV